MGPQDTKTMCTLLNNNAQWQFIQTNQNLLTTYNRSMEE
jgi:hypothetical protein